MLDMERIQFLLAFTGIILNGIGLMFAALALKATLDCLNEMKKRFK